MPIHIPAGCTTLDKSPVDPQKRVGLQGAPAVGKTWASLTFPNPVVLNLDRGLGAHVGRTDVIDVPLYDGTYCDTIVRRDGQSAPPNRRDTVKRWLSTEALKLGAEQTLVIDGLTNIDSAIDTQYNLNPVVSKSGEIDKFAPWRQKIDYYSELFDSLTALKCNVVLLCHETADRDSKGELNGKLRPLLSGQFGDRLVGKLTDFFRCHAFQKPRGTEQIEKAKVFFGVDDTTIKEWCSKTANDCMYLWQTVADDKFNAKASSLVNHPKWIYADYSSFEKYKRKINI